MKFHKAKKYLFRSLAVIVPLWLAFVALIAYEMHQTPEQFGRFMSHMPIATFFVAPFETMWVKARAGHLEVGHAAPDFRLKTLDKTSEVSLSSFRGKSPVVLIFGSYT